MAKKKIKELSVEDFPSLELTEEQLNEWKEVQTSMVRNQMILAGIVLFAAALMWLLIGEILLPGLLVVLVIQFLLQSKYKRISKELGITNKLMRQAQNS